MHFVVESAFIEKWPNISKNTLQHWHSGRQRTVKGIAGGVFGVFLAVFTNENQPKSNYQLRKQITFFTLVFDSLWSGFVRGVPGWR